MAGRSRASNGRSSIHESSDGWHGWVSMGEGPDGRPQRRHVRGQTRAAVTKRVRALEKIRDEGPGATLTPRVTLSAYLDEWVATKARLGVVRPKTIEGYRTDLLRIGPAIGHVQLRKLTARNVEYLWAAMVADGVLASVQHCRRTLKAAISDAVSTGLLQAADGGVLYVDEVNLLADHLVDLLLDAAATGVVRVERDAVSELRSARFVLVGSMNPEEGELRPQLLDRFGLSALVRAPADPAQRAEAVRRRVAFDRDPAGEAARWAGAEAELLQRLAAAHPAPVPDGLAEQVSVLCAGAGAEGLRADLVICRAAAALAGWEGRAEASADDVRRVAPLALAHRRSSPWDGAGPGAGGEAGAGGGGGEDLDDLLDEVLGGEGAGGPGAEAPDEVDGGPAGGARTGDPERGGEGTFPRERGQAEATEPRPPPPPPPPPPAPADVPSPVLRDELAQLARRRRSPAGASAGVARRSPDRSASGRGRLVGSRAPAPGEAPNGVHPAAALLAAVERRAPGGAVGPLRVHPADVREPVRRQPTPTLVVVDASGSMGVAERVAAARSAVLALLVDAYQRRDRVALVTFRGEAAEAVLRPTGSTEVARARLDAIATGGRTPLAAGLAEGLRVATARRHAADRALLVLVTDGRATAGPVGEDPVGAAMEAARAVRHAGIDALVVDCEAGAGPRLGLAAQLAAAMGARHVAAEGVTGDGLAAAVGDMLTRSGSPA
ncbi:MAG: VWA domain-containing protein [Acidimicrobiales bacterium]